MNTKMTINIWPLDVDEATKQRIADDLSRYFRERAQLNKLCTHLEGGAHNELSGLNAPWDRGNVAIRGDGAK